MKLFKETLIGIAIVLVLISVVTGVINWMFPRDSTDSPDKRSSMSLLIDHGTGCHYLKIYGFMGVGTSITPRIDSEGKPICWGMDKEP